MNKLILGTANFGCDYFGKRVDEKESVAIRDVAIQYGIDTVDTSPYYGDAENIISKYYDGFKVITKDDPLKITAIAKPYANLLHHFKFFHHYRADYEECHNHIFKGMKLGVSVYRGYEVETILESEAKIDIVQLPYNIRYQGMDNYFYHMRQKGIEVHVRSVFDRGSILNKETALQFVLKNPLVSKVVIGVDSANHLHEIARWAGL